MTTQQAIEHFGGRRNLANALNISVQGVHKWGQTPPLLRQYQIEIITKRKLKAEKNG